MRHYLSPFIRIPRHISPNILGQQSVFSLITVLYFDDVNFLWPSVEDRDNFGQSNRLSKQ